MISDEGESEYVEERLFIIYLNRNEQRQRPLFQNLKVKGDNDKMSINKDNKSCLL